ncbi:MAG: flagellin [Steroidobacteraceae bacterium]
MPLTINTNVGALQAQRATTGAGRGQEVAMQRLATGVRLNSAADDAAGIAVAARMSNQIRGLDMALRNAQDGLSLARTAENAIEEMQQILQRMRELAVQSANGSYADTERIALNAESAALLSEIRRISTHTRWDRELNLFDGSQTQIAVQAGMQSGDTVVIPLESLTPLALGFTGIEGLAPTRPINTFDDGHDGIFEVTTFAPPRYDGDFTLTVGNRTLSVNAANSLDDIVNGLRSAATAAGYDNTFQITQDATRIKLTWVDRKGPQARGVLTRTGELPYAGANTLGTTATQQLQTFPVLANRNYRLSVGNVDVTSAGVTDLPSLVQSLSTQLPPDAGFTLGEENGNLKLIWNSTGPQNTVSLIDQTTQTSITGTITNGITGQQVQVFDTVYFTGDFSLTIDGSTYQVTGATSRDDVVTKFQNLPGYADLGFEILSNSPRGFKLVWKTDGPQVLGTLIRNGPYPYYAQLSPAGHYEETAVQTLDPGVYSGDFTLVVSSNDPRFTNYQRSLAVTQVTDRADLVAKLNAANLATGGDPLFSLTNTPPSITLTWNTIGFRPQAVLTRDGETRSTGHNQYTGNDTPWAIQKFDISTSAYGIGQDIELTAGGKTIFIEDAISLDDLVRRLNDPELLRDLPTGIKFYTDDSRLVVAWDDVTNQGELDLKINGDTLRLLTVREALTALSLIDTAAEKVVGVRARLGAASNRIEYLTGNLLNFSQNTRAARSTLEDTDYAAESARLASAQILSEASTAMLVQANQSQQYVLSLLSPR